MIKKIRKWFIRKLAGKMKVAINCNLLDYNMEKNFMSGEFLSHNNKFYSIVSLITEEMYTGSAGKKVYRRGNSFVLTLN